LFEDQSCQISSLIDLKRRSLRLILERSSQQEEDQEEEEQQQQQNKIKLQVTMSSDMGSVPDL